MSWVSPASTSTMTAGTSVALGRGRRGRCTIGTASQQMNCGDPTLFTTMNAVTRARASGGNSATNGARCSCARMPMATIAPTTSTSSGVIMALANTVPCPVTW